MTGIDLALTWDRCTRSEPNSLKTQQPSWSPQYFVMSMNTDISGAVVRWKVTEGSPEYPMYIHASAQTHSHTQT